MFPPELDKESTMDSESIHIPSFPPAFLTLADWNQPEYSSLFKKKNLHKIVFTDICQFS